MADGSDDLTFDQRVAAVKILNDSYGLERMVHLLISLASAGGLLYFGFRLLEDTTNTNTLISMFGPAGLIAAIQGRALFLWTETAKILRGK